MSTQGWAKVRHSDFLVLIRSTDRTFWTFKANVGWLLWNLIFGSDSVASSLKYNISKLQSRFIDSIFSKLTDNVALSAAYMSSPAFVSMSMFLSCGSPCPYCPCPYRCSCPWTWMSTSTCTVLLYLHELTHEHGSQIHVGIHLLVHLHLYVCTVHVHGCLHRHVCLHRNWHEFTSTRTADLIYMDMVMDTKFYRFKNSFPNYKIDHLTVSRLKFWSN